MCVNETGVFLILAILINSVSKIETKSSNVKVRDALINVVYNIVMRSMLNYIMFNYIKLIPCQWD